MKDAAENPVRRELVGRTTVLYDQQGPFRFIRDGGEVGCVCDTENGIVCRHHATPDQAGGPPVKPQPAEEATRG